MGNNLQNYGGFDIDVFEKDSDEIAKSSRSNEYMKIEEGDNVVRFLPPPKNAAWAKRSDGTLSPFKVVHEHWYEVPGLKKKIRFVCPRMHGGGFCPACDEADALVRTGNPFDRDKSKEIYPSPRTYANVIDRNDESRGPKVLAFGKTIRDGLVSIRKRHGDFTSPTDAGFDIIIEQTKNNGKTDYAVTAERTNSGLGDEEWLEKQYNLDTYAFVQTLDEIKEMMSGSGSRGGRGRQLDSGRDNKRLADGRGGSSSRGGDRDTRQTSSRRQQEPERGRQSTAADDVIDAEVLESEMDDALAAEDDALPA